MSGVSVFRFSEMDGTERAAHITARLLGGERLTARQIAQQYGITPQWANETLNRVGRVVPVYRDSGLWRVLECLGE